MATPANSADAPPIPRLRVLQGFAWAAWLFTFLAAALLWGEFLASVLHPWAWTFIVLAIGSIASTLGCLILGVWRALAGPSRMRALGLLALGLVPATLIGVLIAAGADQYRRGQISRSVPFIAFAMAGASLGEIEARWRYPHRLESDRLVMYYDSRVTNPQRELEDLDRHVANLERMMKRPLRAKIWWVRGTLLGQRWLSIAGTSLGSDASPARAVDRHELAHAVMYQAMTPATSPTMLLAEGWAESRSCDVLDLAERALNDRATVASLATQTEDDRRKSLAGWADAAGYEWLARRSRELGPERFHLVRELTEPWWYHRDRGAAYNVGGAFVDYLVRTYGADRFVEFYLAVRPGQVDEACKQTLGHPLDDVESHFWRECERLIHRIDAPR